jgi:hypothetical protein
MREIRKQEMGAFVVKEKYAAVGTTVARYV